VHGHLQHVRRERELCHVEHGVGRVSLRHARFGPDAAVRLRHAHGHACRDGGDDVAKVNLAARDLVSAPVEGNRLCEPGDRVLTRRVRGGGRTWRGGRDGAVVDDAPALGRLITHHAVRVACDMEGRVQVDVDHAPPVGILHLVERRRRHIGARVVEEEIETTEVGGDGVEEAFHICGERQVGRMHEYMHALAVCLADLSRRLLEHVGTTARQHDRHLRARLSLPASRREPERDGAPYPCATARDESDAERLALRAAASAGVDGASAAGGTLTPGARADGKSST